MIKSKNAMEVIIRLGRTGIYFEDAGGGKLRMTGRTALIGQEGRADAKEHKAGIAAIMKKYNGRLYASPDTEIFNPEKPPQSACADLIEHMRWQPASTVHWVYAQAAKYRGKCRSWDLPECTHAAIRDLVAWQKGEV